MVDWTVLTLKTRLLAAARRKSNNACCMGKKKCLACLCVADSYIHIRTKGPFSAYFTCLVHPPTPSSKGKEIKHGLMIKAAGALKNRGAHRVYVCYIHVKL
jgi:hypothetical protein